MKKCQFQKGPTCQIFALKNAVKIALEKQNVTFGKKDRYKFNRLEQLINDADKCKSLNRRQYFYSSKKKEDYENERLPTYVAIFARAFPMFKGIAGNYNIQFNYQQISIDALNGSSGHWSNYLEEMDYATTFVLILQNIMLGQSEGMLDPDGHEITFGTSANIFGWKKTFTALRAVTSPEANHAVAIEDVKIFGNKDKDVNVNAKELFWYYDLLRVSMFGLRDNNKYKEEWSNAKHILQDKFSYDQTKLETFEVNNEDMLNKISLLKIIEDNDLYGYLEILDSNKIGRGNQNCRWMIPFSQFDYVVQSMIKVIPLIINPKGTEEWGDSPFVFDSNHYLLGGLNTVQSTEKSIYKQESDKLLTEQEIETILLEGYNEEYYYETGQKILENDRVRVYGYDFEWRVVLFDDEDEILVNPVNQTKNINLYTNEEYLTFISREPDSELDSDSDNDNDLVGESKLKKQKIKYKIKF